jgi:hypothetical protein
MNWFQWVIFIGRLILTYGPKILAMALDVYREVQERRPLSGTRVAGSDRDLFAERLLARVKQEGKHLDPEQIAELRRYAKLKTHGRAVA